MATKTITGLTQAVELSRELLDLPPGPVMRALSLQKGDGVCMEQGDFVFLGSLIAETEEFYVVVNTCWVQHKGPSDRDFHRKGRHSSAVQVEARGPLPFVIPKQTTRLSPWRSLDPALAANFIIPTE